MEIVSEILVDPHQIEFGEYVIQDQEILVESVPVIAGHLEFRV